MTGRYSFDRLLRALAPQALASLCHAALVLIAALALALIVPAPSLAALNLEVADCGGPSVATWSCATNTGAAVVIVGSIRVPVLTSLVAAESVVDLGFEPNASGFPDWWRIGAGLCRPASQMQVSHVSTYGGASCVTYFEQYPSSTTSQYVIGGTGLSPEAVAAWSSVHAVLYISTTVDPAVAASAIPPAYGDQVLLFTIRINRAQSTGTGACAGCDRGACIAFLQTRLKQLDGPDHVEHFDPQFPYVSLQGGDVRNGTCYFYIPDAASRSTWGQVKAMYR